MKTINDAANEFCISNNLDYDPAKSAFKAGVKHACNWIKVADELPEKNEFLIKRTPDLVWTSEILVKTDYGTVLGSRRVLCIDDTWDWCPNVQDEAIVEWRLLDYE